jgi:hypothetical protein
MELRVAPELSPKVQIRAMIGGRLAGRKWPGPGPGSVVAAVTLSRSKSISVCWVVPTSANRSRVDRLGRTKSTITAEKGSDLRAGGHRHWS